MYPYGDTRTETAPVYDDRDEREARWTIRLLAVSLFVVVMAATLVFSLFSLEDESPTATADRPAQVETVTTLAPPAQVGPPAGTDVAGYIAGRKTALAATRDERLAVVSLAKYSTQAQVRTLMGTTPIVALLVAPPGIAPDVVTGDLAAWAKSQTAATTTERDEIKKLIPTVTDAGFKTFYTAEVARLEKALKSFAPDSALVFGAVVKGPAAALLALGAKAEVRLVDVSETATATADMVYRGLRPEEVTKANDPAMRPA